MSPCVGGSEGWVLESFFAFWILILIWVCGALCQARLLRWELTVGMSAEFWGRCLIPASLSGAALGICSIPSA